MLCFFFFQAEDGIRDYKVTGVQTCALPISEVRARDFLFRKIRDQPLDVVDAAVGDAQQAGGEARIAARLFLRGSFQNQRSEERRVGKECRSRWSPYH